MKVGDLVRLKETGELGIIVEAWMRGFIPSFFVNCFGEQENWIFDLDDLEKINASR